MTTKSNVTLRVPPELMERIKGAAETEDRSISNWLRRAAEAALQPQDETSGAGTP